MRKIFIIILFVIIVFGIYFNHNTYVDEDLRYNTIIEEYLSPNEKYKAIVFERNINATTNASYHVSIINSNEKLNDSKENIYISNQLCDISWINESNLQIININERECFKKKRKKGDIFIKYNK